jgi:hypothetical protein
MATVLLALVGCRLFSFKKGSSFLTFFNVTTLCDV